VTGDKKLGAQDSYKNGTRIFLSPVTVYLSPPGRLDPRTNSRQLKKPKSEIAEVTVTMAISNL